MKSIKLYAESVKNLNKKFLITILLDFALFALLYYIVMSFFNLLLSLSQNIPQFNTNLIDVPIEQIYQQTSIASQFVYKAIFLYIFYILLIVLIYTIFKGIIWSIILKKKLKLTYFYKFYTLNLIWLGTIIILFILIQPTSPTIVLPLLLIITYLTLIINITFTLKEKVFRTLAESFKTSITKLPKYLPTLILIIITFILLSIVSLIFKNASQLIQVIISIIFLLVFMAWSRNYFTLIYKQ